MTGSKECPPSPMSDSKDIDSQGQKTVKLYPAVQPTRKCGMAVHLRNRLQRYKQMIVGVLCGCWNCLTCGIFLKRKWYQHLAGILAKQDRVFVLPAGKREWEAVGKRIYRAGGEFARIEQDNETLVVFTDAPIGDEVGKGEVLSTLTEAIDGATFRHRPVSTSAGWRLLTDTIKVDKREWELVNRLSVQMGTVKDYMETIGLKVNTFYSMDKIGFYVDLPKSWDEEKFKRFARSLDGLTEEQNTK